MDNLPQDLVDRISSNLERNDLKNTLSLSPQFQRAAEQYSEAFSTYSLSEENVDNFVKIYGGRLAQYLRKIKFRTILPALDMGTFLDYKETFEDNPCRDNMEELKEMDEDFTRQVNLLFSTLEKLEQAGTLGGHSSLELEIYTPTRARDDNAFCIHRVFTSWRVRVISPETLPRLTCIRSLLIQNGSEVEYDDIPDPPFRKPDLRIILDLAARLPNLQVLKCNIGGDEWSRAFNLEAASYSTQEWQGPRRDSRHDFAQAYQVTQLPSLSHANLDFIYPIYKADSVDQRLQMPNLVKPAINDPFSSSLRLLSYQLRTMRLKVVADETLFWPDDGSTPSWPNLESLSVMFHIASPSGTWYFEGPLDVGAKEGFEVGDSSYPPWETTEDDRAADRRLEHESFEWNAHRIGAQYRVKPNNKTLVQFLTAFAKAAALMPSLKEATLWAPLMFNVEHVEGYYDFDDKSIAHDPIGELAWGISYAKPRTQAFTEAIGEDYASFRQMWWYVGEWRPTPKLLGLFRQIGRKEHGGKVSMYWGDPVTSPGLVQRDVFDEWESHRFNH